MTGLLILSLFPWLVIFGGGGYLALRFVRAFERRGLAKDELEALQARIQELEAQFDGMQKDVERLSDEQSFTTKLLSDRSGS